MIDDPAKTEHLLERLREHLPFPAVLSSPAAAILRKQVGNRDVPPQCEVTQLQYAGDEGGIVCGLALTIDTGDRTIFISITHLLFDRRMPLAREIAAYQKHRIKRIRRRGATS
ncbi:MAG TPA: hypothetical protein VK196_08005 [Magnetospirillum sp.]|nr:hypothetical protein [Magnetospirillum sp.]